MAKQKFIKLSNSLFVDADFEQPLTKLGLASIDAVFSFNSAKNLSKKNLASFRSRLEFQVDSPLLSEPVTVFMKRYDRPPIVFQIKNWLAAGNRKSCSEIEFQASQRLTESGINTPKTVACGTQWGAIFEKRSFLITEKIPKAESLERKLPACFNGRLTTENLRLRRVFFAQLADFIRKFHQTNFCHRDLYFSHIFDNQNGDFFLIDLARAFRPVFLKRRFLIKDIAQLHYSADARFFSNTDRLRFYKKYSGRDNLTNDDKVFINDVMNKAYKMAQHAQKHGRQAPFNNRKDL
jgi:hypothetical protein